MTQQSDHSSRHAGFELLRIISMMMIVLMHGIGHGGLGTTAAPEHFPILFTGSCSCSDVSLPIALSC